MSIPKKPKSPEVQTPGNVAVQKQGAISPASARPKIEGRKLPSNIHRLPGRKPRRNQQLSSAAGAVTQAAIAPGFASGTVSGAADIEELARALKDNVDLIYEFVHNQIEWLPTYGSQKGAFGTLVDGFGNSFDQAELMIELLREAGYTANFQFGELELSQADASAWFGSDASNIWAASNLLSAGGIPNTVIWTGSAYKIQFNHVWVKVNISGTDYHFDPARKTYDDVAGVNLATAMGYSQSTFLSNARSGATVTSDYVQNIHRSNLRGDLDDYTANLVSWIKSNNPDATLDDLLGGRTIVATTGTLRNTSLPYLKPSSSVTTWTAIPDAYKATLGVLYDTINVSFFSKDVHGKRLTLFFNTSNQAELRLDGSLIATSSAQGTGTWNSVLLSVDHPYSSNFADQSFWQTVWAGKYYLIAQAWGNAGRSMIEVHRKKLDQSRFDGADDDSEEVFGEGLSVLWHLWNAKKSWACDVFNRMTECRTMLHHQVGLVGYYDTPLTDLGGILWASAALDNDWDNVNTNDTALAMHGIAFEAGAIEQAGDIAGISTCPLIDDAVVNGFKIYNGTSSNWASSVKPNLTNYPSQALTDIENWYLNWGWRVILPEDGELTVEDFEGYGFYGVSPWYGAVGIFSGQLQGGMGAAALTIDLAVRGVSGNFLPQPLTTVSVSPDPIDLFSGDYTYSHTDLSVGSQQFPYKLEFGRSYSSGARLSDGPLGLGWSHNLSYGLSQSNDGLLAMAAGAPIAGAAGLVEMFITVDLYRDLTKPVDKWVIVALANKWLLDQSFGNTATVSTPEGSQLFVKLPDGSYVTPYNSSATLAAVAGGFEFTSAQKVKGNFDSSGKLATLVYPGGVTVTFSYTGDKLTRVTNGMGRTLTLSYTGDRITSVLDGTGRSVSFTYDTDGNLTSATDPLSKTTTYTYDEPGRMTKLYHPANPTTAIMTNVYDSLGRIKEQKDANLNTWTYYFAGPRSEEVNPVGKNRVLYFNHRGQPVKDVNSLGEVILTEYDGLGRRSKVTYPEGNSEEYTYDAAGNVLSFRRKAKSGSGLSDLVQTFTYDSTWNKVKTEVDALGNTTTYNYDSTRGNLLSIQKPAVGGSTPTVSYTYNTRGQVLTRTDETGVVRKFNYHSSTEVLLSMVDDDSGLDLTTVYTYDTVGNVASVTDPRGNKVEFTYNARRQLTQRKEPTPFSAVINYTYDDNGNRTKASRETGDTGNPWQEVVATYTVEGQLATLKDPGNNTESYVYDTMRRLWKRTDAASRLTEFLYDDASRPWKVIDAASNVEQLASYTDNGLKASVTDASGNVTELEYDGHDRLKKRIFDDATYEQMTYDANGNVLTFRTRGGNTISFTYDVLNRMVSRAPQGQGTVSMEYDLAGRLKKASKPTVSGDPSTGNFEYFFDSAGRMTKEKYPDGKEVQLQLDDNGNVTRLTYPDGYYVDRVYDELNRLSAVKLNGATSSALAFTYDKLSRRTRLTCINGVVTDYDYELDNDLSLLSQSFVGSSVDFEYGYNSVHELTGQDVDNAAFMWHPAAGGTKSYGTANGVNQYPSVGGSTYSYNNAGALTGDGVWTFGYDTENHLVSAVKTGLSASYVYDPQHRQIQKTVGSVKTRFIYSQLQMIAQYDGVSGNLVDRFVYGLDMDEPLIRVDASGNVTYLHHDKMGSIVAITNASGVVQNTYAYSPFGESASMSGTLFGYTGQRYDAETGLYYYKHRIYSPYLGRFLQPDPIGYTDGLNLYAYVHNSPFVFTDPLGLAADCSCAFRAREGLWLGTANDSVEWIYPHTMVLDALPSTSMLTGNNVIRAGSCGCQGSVTYRVLSGVAGGLLFVNDATGQVTPVNQAYPQQYYPAQGDPSPNPGGSGQNLASDDCFSRCNEISNLVLKALCYATCSVGRSTAARCVRGYIC